MEQQENNSEEKSINEMLNTGCKTCIFNMIKIYTSDMPDVILSTPLTKLLQNDYSIIILYQLLKLSTRNILNDEYQPVLNFFYHTQLPLYDTLSINFHIVSEENDEKNTIYFKYSICEYKNILDCSSLKLSIIMELFVVFFYISKEDKHKFVSNFVYEMLNSKHNIFFLELIMKHDNSYLFEIALSKYDFPHNFLILKKDKDKARHDRFFYKPDELKIDIPMRKIFKYARTVNMLQILCHYCHAESNSDFLRLIKSELNPSTFILNAYCSIDVRDLILIWNIYFRQRHGRLRGIRQPKGVDDPMFHILIPERHKKINN
jgi:hypothetical protein